MDVSKGPLIYMLQFERMICVSGVHKLLHGSTMRTCAGTEETKRTNNKGSLQKRQWTQLYSQEGVCREKKHFICVDGAELLGELLFHATR